MQARTCAFILRFLIETLILDPKSYGDFRKTGPTGYYGFHFPPSHYWHWPSIFPFAYRQVKGTGSRLNVCSLITLLFSNYLLLILSVNDPTHMYLSDLRVYFKVEVYFRVT